MSGGRRKLQVLSRWQFSCLIGSPFFCTPVEPTSIGEPSTAKLHPFGTNSGVSPSIGLAVRCNTAKLMKVALPSAEDKNTSGTQQVPDKDTSGTRQVPDKKTPGTQQVPDQEVKLGYPVAFDRYKPGSRQLLSGTSRVADSFCRVPAGYPTGFC